MSRTTVPLFLLFAGVVGEALLIVKSPGMAIRGTTDRKGANVKYSTIAFCFVVTIAGFITDAASGAALEAGVARVTGAEHATIGGLADE